MLLTESSPSSGTSVAKPAASHPFLVVRKDDFSKLRERAARSPWREQKTAALEDVETLRYHAGAPIDVRSIVLAKILSTTALAYIVDPAGRPRYVERILQHLRPFDPAEPGSITTEMRANPDRMLWRYGVPTGNAFFQGVLALDIIHDDLSAKQLSDIERILRDGPAKFFRDTPLAWKQGSYAAAAIWPLYEGDAAAYRPIVDKWKHHTLEAISADGVFVGGPAYADARWGFADREHKALFGEVLAHAGVLPDWYQEPKLGNFMEWLNGYAYTPFRALWTFGDSAPDKYNGVYQPGNERAYRYSALASRYAAWLRDGLTPPGALGSYVLAEAPPAEPLAAPSRVFADGGAWLKETSTDPRSLSAVLWNLAAAPDAHAHKETNSLCLAAYGELLLRGSGYNGWDTPEQGFSWSYIHDRAIAGNVVLFDYAVPATAEQERSPPADNDHARRYGAGVTASQLTGVVDFARGESARSDSAGSDSASSDSASSDSAGAIPNGRHERNLIFVHPQDGVGGYYAVIDELAAPAARTGQVIWHPASANYVTTAEAREYTWTTDEFDSAGAGLTIFLATPPERVTLHDGVLANWGHGVVGKYLVGHYGLAGGPPTRVLTVLFPQDADHPKADFTRLDLDGGVGVAVRQHDVTDVIFESRGLAAISPALGWTAQARAGWARGPAGRPPERWWLMDAVSFMSAGLRFESTLPVTLLYTADGLQITSPSNVTISLYLDAVADNTARFQRLALSAGSNLLTPDSSGQLHIKASV